MSKKTKVVSITTPQSQENNVRPRLVAYDEASRRFIIAVGCQRTAFDLKVTATRLPPHTGDAPAPVLPVRKPKRSPREQEPA
jgi:hypothetical protein